MAGKNVVPFPVERASKRPAPNRGRDRGWFEPRDIDAISDPEERLRSWLLARLWHSVFERFREFQAEHGPVIDEPDHIAHFVRSYAWILWQLKNNRATAGKKQTEEEQARNYATSARVQIYEVMEKVLATFRKVNDAHLYSDSSEFYDELVALSVHVGGLGHAMIFAADGRLNHAEYHIVHSQRTRRGADARHLKDPKQSAKLGVYEWWKRWQEAPTLYKSKAHFARVMLDKFPVLDSQAVIQDWCRDWAAGRNLPRPTVGR